ncbi:MAG: hypothetical protein IKD22_00580, partial [Lentisphaeria bacterium]|nr:hypothetical protein [Lentisphaeria bacterium]
VTTAARDVAAALQLESLPETPGDNIISAVCEQAIYLLLNVQVLTGAAPSGSESNLSPRAYGLLAALMRKGDTSTDSPAGGSSGSSGSTGDGGSTSGGTGSSGSTGGTGDSGSTSGGTGTGSFGGDLDTGNQTTIKCVNQFRLIRG